jgi:hypothetical protein
LVLLGLPTLELFESLPLVVLARLQTVNPAGSLLATIRAVPILNRVPSIEVDRPS